MAAPSPLDEAFDIHLREVGPPPNTKRRQNSLNRLCSVCAVKKIVCAALFF